MLHYQENLLTQIKVLAANGERIYMDECIFTLSRFNTFNDFNSHNMSISHILGRLKRYHDLPIQPVRREAEWMRALTEIAEETPTIGVIPDTLSETDMLIRHYQSVRSYLRDNSTKRKGKKSEALQGLVDAAVGLRRTLSRNLFETEPDAANIQWQNYGGRLCLQYKHSRVSGIIKNQDYEYRTPSKTNYLIVSNALAYAYKIKGTVTVLSHDADIAHLVATAPDELFEKTSEGGVVSVRVFGERAFSRRRFQRFIILCKRNSIPGINQTVLYAPQSEVTVPEEHLN